ncbi:MAG: aldo/keto reductase, partial [Gemmobacter sp.]
PLGTGGPVVGAIGLGCMSFGGAYGPTDLAASRACLDAAWAAGIDHLDIANIYGQGVCETVVGDWLADRRHPVTLATKGGIVAGPDRRFDNSPAHLRAELDGSLRRLRVDHVALYYLHRRDPSVPIEDVAGLMADLVAAGKIGGWGLSEVAPATLRRAHAIHPVRAVQSEYSLWTRLPELGMIRACTELGVAFVAFSPLGRGMFGDAPVDPARFPPGDFRLTNPRFTAPNLAANEAAIAPLRAFARSRGWPLAALALAWVLDRAPHVHAIPGTRTAAHLADWLPAAGIALTEADRAEIDRLLPPGFAHGARYASSAAAGVEEYA